ncbi:MAG: hypothetical protein EAX90_10345 [Candidatus Heimdallarchaeota archaeon]|nr:hypothetical protein [Candidatus Heimdallarchaeota archaeon]
MYYQFIHFFTKYSAISTKKKVITITPSCNHSPILVRLFDINVQKTYVIRTNNSIHELKDEDLEKYRIIREK